MDQQSMGLVSLLYGCSIRIIGEDVLESAEAGEILGAPVIATCTASLRLRSSSEIHSAGVFISAFHAHGSVADSFSNQTRAECYARHENPNLTGRVGHPSNLRATSWVPYPSRFSKGRPLFASWSERAHGNHVHGSILCKARKGVATHGVALL
jgi:hypothetical protein